MAATTRLQPMPQ